MGDADGVVFLGFFEGFLEEVVVVEVWVFVEVAAKFLPVVVFLVLDFDFTAVAGFGVVEPDEDFD